MLAVCPRCHQLLTKDETAEEILVCAPCAGRFVRGDTAAGAESLVADEVDETWLSCPACLLPMTPLETAPQQHHRCSACQGAWYEPPAEATTELIVPQTALALTEEEVADLSPFTKKLLYGLSLPERTLRTLVGVTAGTTREVAGLLVPMAFQSSKSYEVAIRNSLNFLTENIGGFGDSSTEADEAGEHIARKTVGNFVDLASLSMLHVSPMWLLAVVSDVAYGSSSYLKELSAELKAQGIIDENSSINNVDDFLNAMQKASGDAATTFDRPPFSLEELREVVSQTRESLGEADLRKLVPENEIRQYWTSLNEVAQRDHVSMLDAATAIAMHTAEQSSAIVQGATTGVKVAGNLLQKNVLQHYAEGLSRLREEGFLTVLASTYSPYVSRIWDNYADDKPSWTESLLNPNNVTRVMNWRPTLPKLWGQSGTETE